MIAIPCRYDGLRTSQPRFALWTLLLVHKRKHTRHASAAMILRHRALAVVKKLWRKV